MHQQGTGWRLPRRLPLGRDCDGVHYGFRGAHGSEPAAIMNITLPPDLEKLVDRRVREGSYASPEQMVREAIGLLLKREAWDRLIDEGLEDAERGDFVDGEAFFQQLRDERAARLKTR